MTPVLAAIGAMEITIVLVIIIFLFGAAKIPDLARSLGRARSEFLAAKRDVEREMRDLERAALSDRKEDPEPRRPPP